MFGHGHAAGADIALHVDLALGHGIGNAVGGVAVHHDGGAGIEPSNIIGDRPHDIDEGVGESHGSHPLTGRAGDPDLNLIFTGPPQTSADAVLPVGFYGQTAVPFGHSRLDLFFKQAGFNAPAVDFSGNNIMKVLYPSINS